MSAKPVIRSESARKDEREAVAYYAREAGLDVALRFIDALRDAYGKIADRPGAGSPRFASRLGLPGLRHRTIRRFHYLIFYMEGVDRILVWRVLHAQSDIPAWLGSD